MIPGSSNQLLASRGYTIANSLRLRSSASAYLSRTFGTATSATLFTFSAWVKRGTLGVFQPILSPDYVGGEGLFIDASDKLQVSRNGSIHMLSTQVFRDPSAWFHVVLASDMANGTAANRVRVWINGAEITSWGTDARASFTSWVYWNTAITHRIADSTATANFFDGYLSDVYFIDGQALTPSSFGQTDSNGVWVPKAYSGTFGTNGFFLRFNDGSNTTNLCLDRSGNGNNWTPTNVSLTAGITYDWMVDTPTNNYSTLNPLIVTGAVFSNANLSANYGSVTSFSSMPLPTTGKWYWEAVMTAGTAANLGIVLTSFNLVTGSNPAATTASGYGYDNATGNKLNNGGTAYGTSFTTNVVIGVALDLDAGTLVFYRAGVSQGTAFSGLSGQQFSAYFAVNNTTWAVNFGQRPFTYTNAGVDRPAATFKSLCTANLPAVTIANPKKHFDVVTYSGNNTTRSITGMLFQPDFGWFKSRTNPASGIFNTLYDAVRGSVSGWMRKLHSNSTDQEDFASAVSVAGSVYGGVSSFNSDGFTLTNGSSDKQLNISGFTFVAWLWKANGAGVTNTSGTITSTVSANTTAGFSIVTYTGTGANATVGHALGTVPKMVIVKARNLPNSIARNWVVWHSALTSTEYLYLNTTDAKSSAGGTTYWNSTTPTSSLFSLGSEPNVNGATGTVGQYVAYCFAEVPGFSRMGSYQGNGSSDGPFVFCGFRPRWVMVKDVNNVRNWWVQDAARNTYNVVNGDLSPNLSDAEYTTVTRCDFTSNGFKIRTTDAGSNAASTYIYAAFAESPFGGSNIAPSTAR